MEQALVRGNLVLELEPPVNLVGDIASEFTCLPSFFENSSCECSILRRFP